jgi:hypothetical protein
VEGAFSQEEIQAVIDQAMVAAREKKSVFYHI